MWYLIPTSYFLTTFCSLKYWATAIFVYLHALLTWFSIAHKKIDFEINWFERLNASFILFTCLTHSFVLHHASFLPCDFLRRRLRVHGYTLHFPYPANTLHNIAPTWHPTQLQTKRNNENSWRTETYSGEEDCRTMRRWSKPNTKVFAHTYTQRDE